MSHVHEKKIIGKIQRDHLDALALRMRRGDHTATTALYNELLPKIYGFLFARTSKKEVAEDLSQEIFIKLIEKIKTFDETRGKFTVWFWQVVRRHLIDNYRKKSAIPFSTFADVKVETMAVVPEINFHARFICRRMRQFSKTLTTIDRKLFELRFVAEESYQTIAAATGRRESTLRVAAMRVRQKVRDHLKSYYQ